MGSDLVLIAAIGGIQAVVLAIVGIIGKLLSDSFQARADKTDVKLETIHTQTNSNLSALTLRLDAALAQNKGLQDVMAEMRNPSTPSLQNSSPLKSSGVTPVADERVGEAVDKMADATDKVAGATDKLAEVQKGETK